jgi:hypothetical protein
MHTISSKVTKPYHSKETAKYDIFIILTAIG